MASVNLDISSRLDITCRKNDTFSLDLDIKDPSGNALDLTSYTFKMEVRTSTDDEGSPVIASANISDTADDSGNLNLTITAANMNVSAGTYVYDLQATLSGVVTTWLYGTFKVNEDVTIT
jgi:hypothetical protein